VAVEGSLQTRSYDAQDGSKRYVTEVIADSVEFCDSKPEGAQGGAQPAQDCGMTEIDDEELPF
jgi:single-strand DNA-binding protein